MKSRLIELALMEYGVHEIAGPASNSRVLQYFKEAGHDWVKEDSANAWCSAFMNFLCKQAGLPYTKKLLARSWLDVGKPLETPDIGDLVIFWRNDPNGVEGHVALFIRREGDKIWVLGGNQGDMVCIAAYNASQVLGYRSIDPYIPENSTSVRGTPMTLELKRNLRVGIAGSDVVDLQTILKALGYYFGSINGVFDLATGDAVGAYQKKNGLSPDEIVGPRTYAQILKDYKPN